MCHTEAKAQNSAATAPQTWDKAYGGADKSYDAKLLMQREVEAEKFRTFEFKDDITGRTMAYSLFIPHGYDENEQYPLVLFMADASTVGKGTMAPLKQGYGGFIWATDENQKDNPSFVLVPAFEGSNWVTNDQWQVSEEADVAYRLLQSVVREYSIDTRRLYTTGQSMGGMISFHFNVQYPDLFAASLFVGSQWDTNLLHVLANKKFFYIVSAGDPKASQGMQELKELFRANDVAFAQTEFSAKLSEAEQNRRIDELLKQNQDRNFVLFEKGTTLPEGLTATQSKAGEHMYSFDYAYRIKAVRDWLYRQQKN